MLLTCLNVSGSNTEGGAAVARHSVQGTACAAGFKVNLEPLQAAFLIPAGIILYTVAGGLKATFIASYVHTVIIYFALCIFSLTVYTSSPQLGSPGVVRAWPSLGFGV